MSKENVEATRRAFEAFNRGEIEAVLEQLDEDIVWQTPSDIPESATLRGPEAVKRHLSGYAESFDEFAVDAEEITEVGNCVVASVRLSGRIKGTDASLDLLGAQVLEFTGLGLVTRVREFRSVTQAVEAAGLSE